MKLVAGARGAWIVFLAIVLPAIVSYRGKDRQLEEIRFQESWL